jgi:hypothetical protein
MTLRQAQPIRFSPAGLSDSLDATDEFPGACAALQNLIPDPTTRNIWTCRPASAKLTDFSTSGIAGPGFISVLKVIGTHVYGMIASGSGTYAGLDVPFCYDLAASAFITVTGYTTANLPTSPTLTGDWTPPTMDLAGVNLGVTHPGFSGANYFGWFNLTNPAAPVWNAGNTASGSLITFTTVPSWVVQFNGRLFFGINPTTGQPSVVMTDSLTLKVTNANQALTFGDNLKLTCAAPMPLANQLGGIIQSLMVFKDSSNISQITGDYASTNLAINTLNVATGTIAPRSVVRTPLGLLFVSPDGVRLIDQTATVSDPVGWGGKGVTVPFANALDVTRLAGCCNATTARFAVKSGTLAGNPWVEYWFDIPRKMWSGPHTFAASVVDNYENTFVFAPVAVTAALFQGFTQPSLTTGVIENGTQLTWVMQSAVLEDNQQMAESEVAEMQVKCGGGAAGTNQISVSIQDENGSVINSTIHQFEVLVSVWGTATWGTSPWGAASTLSTHRIDFSTPTVYNRAAIYISGESSNGFRIGDTFIRRRILGYITETD